PQLNLGFRYTRLSEIVNASLGGGGMELTDEQIDAIVGGVTDPTSREIHRGVLTQLNAFGNIRFPVLLDAFSLTAGVAYPLSDAFLSILPAYEGAQENVRAAEHNVDAQREAVAFSAREAYYNFARARGTQ